MLRLESGRRRICKRRPPGFTTEKITCCAPIMSRRSLRRSRHYCEAHDEYSKKQDAQGIFSTSQFWYMRMAVLIVCLYTGQALASALLVSSFRDISHLVQSIGISFAC
jgi:hypothetical protein